MRRRTTTQQIHEALSNNLLQITKVEVYNKTSRKTDVIDVNTFRENLDFLAESGIFMNCVSWYFENNCDSDSDYIAECCRMDRSVDIIVTVYLNVGDGANGEDIDKILSPVEEE